MAELWEMFTTWLVETLYAFASWVWWMVSGFFESAWQWAIGVLFTVWETVVGWVKAALPPEVVSQFEAVGFGSLSGYVEDVSWILPVVPLLSIVAGTYAICGTIRLGRWVIACIPALNLG